MNRPADRLQDQSSAPARFTAAEFLRMADLGAFDDMKVELDDGEILRMTPPNLPHGTMSARIIAALVGASRERDLLVSGEAGVLLGGETVYAFDAALVRGTATDGRCRPDQLPLVVEIADTSLDRDLGRKAQRYAAAGLPLYWVVDVNARVVHVHTAPKSSGYGKREVVRFGEPLDLPEGLGTITLD